MNSSNQFADAVSTDKNLQSAIEAACQSLNQKIDWTPDLVVAMVAGFTSEEFDLHMPGLQTLAQSETVIACSAQDIISGGVEFENQPGVTLWAARLPSASIVPMHLEFERSADGGAIVGWADEMDGEWPEDSTLITLAEPFQFPMDALLARLNEDRPGIKIMGGMTSDAQTPGVSRIMLNQTVHQQGAVLIRLSGSIRVTPVVSQGCRPIGQPLVITAAERNQILQLGGQPALLQVKKMFDQLPTRDQQQVQQGLNIGIVINEYQDKFEYGDFLIRNVIGFSEDDGAVSIGDYVRPGQTVQFHLRDEASASEELRAMLNQAKANLVPDRPHAALLFSCNGRGINMFGDANHDANLIQQSLGPTPLAGFFAAGEIGPVGNQNFMHGFTASVAIFQ